MGNEQQRPEQEQIWPGETAAVIPPPEDEMSAYVGRNLLLDRVALITGGDSGIGRAVAVAFAKEGADVAISYLSEHADAEHTAKLIEQAGRRALLLPGDVGTEAHCEELVRRTMDEFGRLDTVVNNAAVQRSTDDLTQITSEEWAYTFAVNIHSFFWVTKAALAHLPDGAAVINTASVNGLRGNGSLLAYSATKGAVLAFTYATAQALIDRRIRVNAVAPGPVWTPLIPATMPPEKVASFGTQAPLGRPAQPDEIAPSYVFLASEQLSSYYSGQVLTPVGGEAKPG
ncbi:NAD(P)-dependent dehydrogenase, short-chain alcohol dehydrogenase family [Parafrankia irregularis]|uniref:NAD(P)-dependent dehydrogenase, short-chain alcohol dehydrogenase family n=1 Tax=Parafrankia irregularis TaxID=795642 RepID=A0A0S4QP30_9ACTN|nr:MULTISPECIES: SDR family oxidoreductase [Parafrankia]MBE3201315.1 SDR family oxidoreductase [Parafrankia sp. CH37]CUU56234.1 NAD(P)-dependent dehydrogenase, short-chain alcohol dehydrogenase family [Parafrankia irregularis]